MGFERLTTKGCAPLLAVRDAERQFLPVRELRGRLLDPSADEWAGTTLLEPSFKQGPAGIEGIYATALVAPRWRSRNESTPVPVPMSNSRLPFASGTESNSSM